MWPFRKGTQFKSMRKTVTELESLGFYKYAPAEHVDLLTQRAVKNGDLFGDLVFPPDSNNLRLPKSWKEEPLVTTFRAFHLDAELIAEGGAVPIIKFLEPFLVAAGMTPIPNLHQGVDDGGYYITSGDAKSYIYLNDDREQNGPWLATEARFFDFANRLLELSGCNDHLYGLYYGNDLCACLLSPPMFDVIQGSSLPAEHRPYKTCPYPPWVVAPRD